MAQNEQLTPSTLRDPVIQRARIIDVNIASYSVTVATEFGKRVYSDIPFCTPYQHFVNGEGMYFMPEVGSICWICRPSDWNRPVVLAWGPVLEEKGRRGKKKDLNPGDIYLGTRDENFLILRRGGIVQIGGGPLSQRMFIQAENAIKDFCETYDLETLGGSLEWAIAHEEDTKDGKRPATLTISAREFANDKAPIALLTIGSHGEGSQTILSLLINASGEDGAASKIGLELGKDGKMTFTVESDVEWTINGKLKLEVKGEVSIKSSQDKVKIEGQQGFEAKGMTAKMEADTTATVKGGSNIVLDSSVVSLGSQYATSPAVKGDQLASMYASHTHNCTAPGSPSGPPLNAGSVANILSTTVLLK